MNRPATTRMLILMSRPAAQGILFGLFVAILLIATDQVSMRFGLNGPQRVIDDLLGGVIAGLVVFKYARVRLRQIAERLNTVELMNHHIRNALQIIKFSGYIQPEDKHVAAVEAAVARIEWSLREILPGMTPHEGVWHTEQVD